MKEEILQFNKDVQTIAAIPIIDSLLEVICRTTGMGFAAVARVTDEKWLACAVRDEIAFGLVPGGELPIRTTICHEIHQHKKPVIIDEVATDDNFSAHHTPAMYGFQSYISMPITKKDGSFFGTLCAIDPRPNKLNTPETIGMFQLFSDLISFHLAAAEELAASEDKLRQEKETAEFRDQFIAILGHDLRNPLTAVSNSAQLLQVLPVSGQVLQIAGIINSASKRIFGLIENILDFARGQLGEGLVPDYTANTHLKKALEQVVSETIATHPSVKIEAGFDIPDEVNCDGNRVAQLFSNLMSNAVSYGKPGAPIIAKAAIHNGHLRLEVSNEGNKIADVAMARLFRPFSRGEVQPGQQGLGLGLYISSQIAKAHGGTLGVVSTDEQTTFKLEIPVFASTGSA